METNQITLDAKFVKLPAFSSHNSALLYAENILGNNEIYHLGIIKFQISLCKYFPNCIELDLYYSNNDIVIYHGQINCKKGSAYPELESVLNEIIKEYNNLKESGILIYPLIISFDVSELKFMNAIKYHSRQIVTKAFSQGRGKDNNSSKKEGKCTRPKYIKNKEKDKLHNLLKELGLNNTNPMYFDFKNSSFIQVTQITTLGDVMGNILFRGKIPKDDTIDTYEQWNVFNIVNNKTTISFNSDSSLLKKNPFNADYMYRSYTNAVNPTYHIHTMDQLTLYLNNKEKARNNRINFVAFNFWMFFVININKQILIKDPDYIIKEREFDGMILDIIGLFKKKYNSVVRQQLAVVGGSFKKKSKQKKTRNRKTRNRKIRKMKKINRKTRKRKTRKMKIGK